MEQDVIKGWGLWSEEEIEKLKAWKPGDK